MSDVTPTSVPPVSGPPPTATFEEAAFGASEPPNAKRRAGRIAGIALAVAFVLVAGSAAVALYALRGSPDSLGRMAPASADLYVSVNLDPGLGQKANLSRLASRFPALHGTGGIQKSVYQAIDEMLQGIEPGMSFARDVQPWLGSQVAVVGRIDHGGEAAVLIASKDDQAAEAAIAKVAKRSGGSWTTSEHGGVRVHVGHEAGSATVSGAYAIVDHTAVLGSSEQMVDDVIDADQGTAPRLVDSAAYTKTVASLPGDRLALAFVNYPHLVKALTGSAIDPGLLGPVSGGASLEAYQGLGMSLSAASDGLSLDVAAPLDRSKLSPDELATLSSEHSADPLIAWVPAKAFAFIAAPHLGVESFVQSLQNTGEVAPGLSNQLRRLGITGPDGLANHLTGDLVVEGGAGSGTPGGAILLGTDDEAAMQRSLDRMASRLVPELLSNASSRVVATKSGGFKVVHKTMRVRWATVTHNGATIRYVANPMPGPGVQLAYTVTNGMGIVATSPQEVQAVMDTKNGGSSVASAPNFVAAVSHGSTQGDVVYVDFQSLFGMFGGEGISGNLKPLRTLIVTGHQTPDLVTERAFLSIG
jgi:hypothetical protein